MSFFSLFKKKAQHERVLVLHVGSASVAGAFVEVGEGRPRIAASASAEIVPAAEPSHEAVEAEMRRALERAVASLAEMRLDLPDRIVVYLASPWYASQARTARLSRATPFVVSESLVSDMIARELEAFEREEMAASREAGWPLRAMESKVLRARLDGAAVAEPIGCTASELELSLFVSVAQDALLDDITQVIERHFRRPIRFGSFLLASFLAARELFPHHGDYLLVDAGGEVTEAAVVQGDTIVASASFSLGRNHLVREVAAATGRSMGEAASLCMLHGEDILHGPVQATCEGALTEAAHQWRAGLRETLARAGQTILPETVLVTGVEDMLAWFADAVRGVYAEKARTVVPLSAGLFHERMDFSDSAGRLPCIMLETLVFAGTHTTARTKK